MFPCICNAMCHCKLMPCPTCNECHMDNINHTIYLVSWTIISHAYSFQNKHSLNVNTFEHTYCHSSITTTSMLSHFKQQHTQSSRQNVASRLPTQHPNSPLTRALKLAMKSTKQAFKQATIPAKQALISPN